MLDFLPKSISRLLIKINVNLLYEIRLRANKPLFVNFEGKYYFLGQDGLSSAVKNAYFPTAEEVNDALHAACGYSIYAVENQIRQGFITTKNGVRVGICGDVVYEGGSILSIHSVSSLCIRVPHEIVGCAKGIYDRCLSNGLRSVLILAPPGLGKTTMLRDLSRLVCERLTKNVLVCDERGELSCGNVGITSDVVRFAEKKTAFAEGIRAMCPDLIVTDELRLSDFSVIELIREGGVHVFASAHRTDASSIPKGLFDYVVTLNALGCVGSVVSGV
ncbi:MAG: hypothetical protein J6C93_03465 [Clostridia bacterium]|nr:hypothetical protein [Clostridia bacterium]